MKMTTTVFGRMMLKYVKHLLRKKQDDRGQQQDKKEVPCHETGSKFLFRFVERWCRK